MVVSKAEGEHTKQQVYSTDASMELEEELGRNVIIDGKIYLVGVRGVGWRRAADSPGLDGPTAPPQLRLGERGRTSAEGHVDRHRKLSASTPKRRQASNAKANTYPLKTRLPEERRLFPPGSAIRHWRL